MPRIEDRLVATKRQPNSLLKQVDSSQIWSVGYDSNSSELYICYTHVDPNCSSARTGRRGQPVRAGSTYCYYGVSEEQYNELLGCSSRGESIGKFFASNILPYKKVEKLLDGPTRTAGAKLKLVQHLR